MPPDDQSTTEAVIRFALDALSTWQKVKSEEAILYEKRTEVMERMAMALEHYNEKKFHSVL